MGKMGRGKTECKKEKRRRGERKVRSDTYTWRMNGETVEASICRNVGKRAGGWRRGGTAEEVKGND